MLTGANPDELDRAAGDLTLAAGQLTSAVNRLNPDIHNSPWVGGDAARFRTAWADEYRRLFHEAARFLGDCADELRRNAAEQRQTSAAPGPGGRGSGLNGDAAEKERLAHLEDWARSSGAADATRLAVSLPEEQAAWWDSLSEDQRRAMMLFAPGMLLALSGLPASVRLEAEARYEDARRSELAEREESVRAELDVDIRVVHVGANTEATVRKMMDGSYEVSLVVEGELGAALKSKAGLGLRGGGELTYRFDSEAEARAFLDGLTNELVPDKGELARHGIIGLIKGPFGGGAGGEIMADAARDATRYLDRFAKNLTSAEYSVEAYGEMEVKFPSGKMSIEGASGAKYDTVNGTTTIYAEREMSASASLGAKVGGSIAVESSLSFDSQHRPESLKLEFDADVHGGAELKQVLSGMGDASTVVERGGSVSVSASVDLRNPAVAEMAKSYLEQAAAGDPAAGTTFRRLLNVAEVTAQVKAEANATNSVDAEVATLQVSQTTSATIATYVKPPNGSFRSLAGTGSGSGGGGGGGGGW